MTETMDGIEGAENAGLVVEDIERTRTYSWNDPMASFAEGADMSGIEFLRAMAEGRIPRPPISQTLGFDGLGDVDEGRVVFTMTPAEHHYNPIGSVHGGVYATLLDSACGCAVQSLLPAGDFYTSLDLSVKFLRGMTKDTGQVQCIGTVTHMGRRTALAEARIVDGNGKLYATATSTCMVFRAGDK
ncbi:uncharacterized protein (TIGR00369 family) [Catenulispora sp. MAP12-49]|uniref:PaaI family thioesterase n=1 Tax=unclassified Catenulispora TaxID=414885 RepID=UPI0035114AE2